VLRYTSTAKIEPGTQQLGFGVPLNPQSLHRDNVESPVLLDGGGPRPQAVEERKEIRCKAENCAQVFSSQSEYKYVSFHGCINSTDKIIVITCDITLSLRSAQIVSLVLEPSHISDDISTMFIKPRESTSAQSQLVSTRGMRRSKFSSRGGTIGEDTCL
jgi:hypothetical protein